MKRKALRKQSSRQREIKHLHELWRELVYARDQHTCQVTGKRTGLNPHHIYPKHGFPSLRFDPDNGLTLNAGAHLNWHDERFIEGLSPRQWWEKKYPQRAARLELLARIPRKVDLAAERLWLEQQIEKLEGI